MAFIPVPNTAQAEIRYLFEGQKVENTLWFEFPSNPDESALSDMCQNLIDWQIASILPYLSNDLQLASVKLTSMNNAVSPTAELQPVSATYGGVSGTRMPNSVAWSVQFKTAGRGRSARGRNYMTGIPLSALDLSNSVSATFATNIVNGYLDIISDQATWGVTWVVASRYHNNAPRSSGVNSPITAVTYADLWLDSQRRRLPTRGL